MKKFIIAILILLLPTNIAFASDTLSGFPVKIGQSFSDVQMLASQYGYKLESHAGWDKMASPNSYSIMFNQKSIGSVFFKDGLLANASMEWLNTFEHQSLEKLFTALETISQGRTIKVELTKNTTPSSSSKFLRFDIENGNQNIFVIIHDDGQDKSVQIFEMIN